jgi:hypothetical protein
MALDVIALPPAGVLAQDVCKGYNGTIFAYGQTGTGKTYTMLGPEDPDRPAGALSATAPGYDTAKRGIIPRVMDEVGGSCSRAGRGVVEPAHRPLPMAVPTNGCHSCGARVGCLFLGVFSAGVYLLCVDVAL